MRKFLALQIAAMILISGGFLGVVFFTEVYSEVNFRIVTVICLSCIKLDPVNSLDFRFDTANGKDNPKFIKDFLDDGPIFIAFRTDVCEYCDYMEPLIQKIFNVSFEKEETVVETIDFSGSEITFIHINEDWATDDYEDLELYYDVDGYHAVPMFTTITLGYHHGFIYPFYNTVYGILNKDYTYEQRINLLKNIIQEAIELYKDNRPGYIDN